MTNLMIYMTGYALAGLMYQLAVTTFLTIHACRMLGWNERLIDKFFKEMNESVKSTLKYSSKGGLLLEVIFGFIGWPITYFKAGLETYDMIDEYAEFNL